MKLKYGHLPIHTFLLTFPNAFGFDPRAASLQKREPKPGFDFFSCCTKPTDTSSGSEFGRVVPEDFAEPEKIVVPRPELEVENLKPYPAEPKPYPTQINPPVFTLNGERYLIALVAVNLDKKVLLIRDRRGTEGWRLPEGDWGQDEVYIDQALSREARDTAGIDVPWTSWNRWNEPKYLGEKETNLWKEPGDVTKVAANGNTHGARSHYYEFVAHDEDMLSQWADQGRWERKWAASDELESLLATNHPEHFEMLGNSNLLFPRAILKDPARTDDSRAKNIIKKLRPQSRT